MSEIELEETIPLFTNTSSPQKININEQEIDYKNFNNIDDEDDYDDDDDHENDEIFIDKQPAGRRWDPLGAAANNDNDKDSTLTQFDTDSKSNVDPVRLKSLEDEQEMLSSSLLALTSHFAQVQFRLRQIVDAPAEQRDNLLQNLEEFAFRGIPEVTKLDTGEHEDLFKAMELQRARQFELIEQLRKQLCEAERFAYESGSSKIPPQSVLVEKQKIIIDELKNKLNLNVCDDDLPQLTTEQLRNQVDTALGELVGPIKMKDTLVGQLKTQIVDLERFVAYLQCETSDLKQMTKSIGGFNKCETVYSTYNSKMAKSRKQQMSASSVEDGGGGVINDDGVKSKQPRPMKNIIPKEEIHQQNQHQNQEVNSIASKAANVLDKASALLSIFAVTQLGCGSNVGGGGGGGGNATNHFQKNTLKKTDKGNHWGDLRAQLEIDIQEIISLVSSIPTMNTYRRHNHRNSKLNKPPSCSESDDDNDGEGVAGGGGGGGGNVQSTTSATTTENDDDDDDDDDDEDEDDEDENKYRNNSNRRSKRHRCRYTSNIVYSDEALASIQMEITTTIRKHFAVTLQRLMEHGLHEDVRNSNSLVPFIGCFGRRYVDDDHDGPSGGGAGGSGAGNYDGDIGPDGEPIDRNMQRRQMHVWELILEYYHIKNGDKFNETPARKLSQSFNLDISGPMSASSNKQSLLSAIGSIISIHAPYKRSYNSHFKALISTGLNCQKLTQWLNLIFQCRELIQQYYSDWSYVRRTGFRDGLKSIDRLSCYHFNLPVDLAVRQFQNIKDVFM